jgi:hypothetical protein
MSDQEIVVNQSVGTAEPMKGIYREFPFAEHFLRPKHMI